MLGLGSSKNDSNQILYRGFQAPSGYYFISNKKLLTVALTYDYNSEPNTSARTERKFSEAIY
jgi:hypothetical protein